MADNYFRLVCFIVDICPEPLREFFIQLAKKDAGSTYTSLDVYLTRRKLDIEQLHKKKIIRTDQLNLIFPSHGTGNEADWDVTLLVTLITNLFPQNIQSETSEMNKIRKTRNTIQHISDTAKISNTDFNRHWGDLESAAMTLAQGVFSATELISFKTKIDELKKNRLPNLVECLRLWYEETVKHMANKIDNLENKLNDVESNTRQTNSILQNVTAKKPGRVEGDKNKRFKAVDNILKGLQANFEGAMRELPKTFSAPAEADNIRTKLRDKHHVVVTGYCNSRYFETALAAIKEMGYNNKRCVLMQKSSDWRHIDPEDVDLVLCRDPFGSITFDGSKLKGMADIFNSMKHTADSESGERIDILISTDIAILSDCKRQYSHDILDEEVKVFQATTEQQPADLTTDHAVRRKCSFTEITFSLRMMTDNFLRLYNNPNEQVDSHFLEKAKKKIQSKKAIVLSGTKNCEKTAAAVALTSSYEPSRCLLLTEPNDVKYIDWQHICLVIIDDFAGKYRYEEDEVYKWYNMFDHLYRGVTAGQIQVIITSEQNNLKRCKDTIAYHPLLEHVLELPDRAIKKIKEEANIQEGESHLRQLKAPVNLISEYSRTTVGTSGLANLSNTLPVLPVRNAEGVIPVMSDRPVISSQLHRYSYRKEQESEESHLRQLEAPVYSISEYSRTIAGTSGLADLSNTLPGLPVRNADGGMPVMSDWPVMSSQLHHNSYKKEQESGKLTALRDFSIPRRQSEERANSIISKRLRVWHQTTYNIKLLDDLDKCYVIGCCWLPSGEILLLDSTNDRLKKLDINYTVVGNCEFSCNASSVCYIGYNEAVVSSSFTLHIYDVDNMRMTRSVYTDHLCYKLASYGNLLYVNDLYRVYVYDINGFRKRVFYTPSSEFFTEGIAVSNDGSKIYITSYEGLVTLDSSGNPLYTLFDHNLSLNDVCVNDEGHVLVYEESSNRILQVSSDGRQILGTLELSIGSLQTMYFDRLRSALVVYATGDNHLTVLDMERK